MDWFDFHEVGNADCDACAILPVMPCDCGKGLMHTQFAEELDIIIEGRCDACDGALSKLSVVIET